MDSAVFDRLRQLLLLINSISSRTNVQTNPVSLIFQGYRFCWYYINPLFTASRYPADMSIANWNARAKLIALLGISCAMSLGMVFVRVDYTDSLRYMWLIWNLFLALIPFAISSFMLSHPRTVRPGWIFGLALALWLLFFPNAPYVITDFIHLRPSGVPLWYDLLLIMSFAWNGLLFGLISLSDMQEMIRRKFGSVQAWVFVGATLLLTGFGIYLGRFLRWNSWDLFTNPAALFSDIADRVLNPLEHLPTYTFTFGFAAFLLLAYLVFKQFAEVNQKTALE